MGIGIELQEELVQVSNSRYVTSTKRIAIAETELRSHGRRLTQTSQSNVEFGAPAMKESSRIYIAIRMKPESGERSIPSQRSRRCILKYQVGWLFRNILF
jgi:hypothetical protein